MKLFRNLLAIWLLLFASVAYAPAKIFIEFNLENIAHLLSMQLFWLFAIGMSLLLLNRHALKRVVINGG